jgi:hypothetical protein
MCTGSYVLAGLGTGAATGVALAFGLTAVLDFLAGGGESPSSSLSSPCSSIKHVDTHTHMSGRGGLR